MNVAITGCGTLNKGKLISETEFFSIYPELKAYRGNIELLGEIPKSTENAIQHNLGQSSWLSIGGLYTKHFIVIQNGCDNYCSFCLTVMKRGQHRSRPKEDIIAEIQQIEAQGGKEIVLT
ncbi:MAG: radical SAM protein [Candidatus Peribacteria bacterium]|jgi:tRNA A37 methylthiotransferase MiaB|nr:radical SAM protein [Candidatus Peribacteria bacterium]